MWVRAPGLPLVERHALDGIGRVTRHFAGAGFHVARVHPLLYYAVQSLLSSAAVGIIG